MNDNINKIGKTIKNFEDNLAIKQFDAGISKYIPKCIVDNLDDINIAIKKAKLPNNTLKDFFENKLKFYMGIRGITQKQLAEKLGVTEGAVNKWANGTRFPKDEDRLLAIVNILGITIADIFKDTLKQRKLITKQELQYNLDEYADLFPNKLLPSTVKTIQLINGYVGAGSFGTNDDQEVIDKIYVDIHTIEKAYRNKELQAIRVFGDSMTPYVNDGDIALFCKFNDGEAPVGDGKYIISTTQGEQIKNLKFMLNGNIRIISENPSYHTKDGYDEEINKESQEYLKIIGKVVGRILKG